MTATIGQWLEQEEFDWENGRIVYQPVAEEDYSPGWSFDTQESTEIDSDHPILDEEFDEGYGSPDAPRFVAYDDEFVYFPYQYDGSTGIVKVALDPEWYIGNSAPTPYPGG